MMARMTWPPVGLLTIAASTAILLGQARTAAQTEQVTRLTTQLARPVATERIEAFYGLIDMGAATSRSTSVAPSVQALLRDYPQQAETIQASMTRTLETENAAVKGASDLSEDYSDYYGDLIAAVVSFNDARSARALSDAIGTGNMVIRRLASFGQAALEPVLAQLATDPATGRPRDVMSRQGASIVLGLLLDPENPASIKDPATRARIKDALKVAARDAASAYARTAAVESLARVNDPDVVNFLKDVIAQDNFQATVGKPSSFPVREAAALALAKVSQNTQSATAAKPALEALTQLGRDGSTPGAREAAAQALTSLATDQQATPPAVRTAARDALRRLGFGVPATPAAAATPAAGTPPPGTSSGTTPAAQPASATTTDTPVPPAPAR